MDTVGLGDRRLRLLPAGVVPPALTETRRQAGSKTHWEIGRQTDLVRTAGALQTVLLIAIGVVLLLLAAVLLRGLA